MRKLYFTLLFNVSLFLNGLYSQGEGNNWYFSQNAGITFNTSPPSPIQNSAINTADNSSSISDKNGNLLFYTDGVTVYNKNNQLMQGGNNLMGSVSGGQSTLIVNIPGSSRFIVFSVPDVGNMPLFYSEVDMNALNGLGAVVKKNGELFRNSTEKIAAVYNCEDNYFWVVTHQYNSNAYFVYKIDSNGLNLTPVISRVGLVHQGGPPNDVNNAAGQLSISKNGNKIASVLYYSGQIELADFNISTGQVSNSISIDGLFRPWGVEFSSDGSKLYLTRWTFSDISQYDLSSNSINDIVASKSIIGNASGTGGIYFSGYLQRGPDDKIYIAQWDSKFLSVINKPNALGLNCDFQLNDLNIVNGRSKAGLCRTVFAETCYSPCNLICKQLEWVDWKRVNNHNYEAKIKSGFLKLSLDLNTGFQHSFFNTINLNSNLFRPSQIINVPTPWMPGLANNTKLIHKITLDNIVNANQLLLLIGEFPNSGKYSGPQYGKLRIYDSNHMQLSLDSICEHFQDPLASGIFSRINIIKSKFEWLFDVNSTSLADGGVLVLGNLSKEAKFIEIEHNNELSSRDDGIYITIGAPNCCTSSLTKVDSISCNSIRFNNKQLVSTGIYRDTVEVNGCDSILELNFKLIPLDQLNIFNDTSFCNSFIYKARVPDNYTLFEWSNGFSGRENMFSTYGDHWLCVNDSCGRRICDTITINQIPGFIINTFKDTAVNQGSFLQFDVKINGTKPASNYQFSWMPRQGLSCYDCPNPIAIIRNTNKYRLIVKDLNTGCESVECIIIKSLCCK